MQSGDYTIKPLRFLQRCGDDLQELSVQFHGGAVEYERHDGLSGFILECCTSGHYRYGQFSVRSPDVDEEEAYREYQSALRRFNNDLKSLSRKLRISSSVTSYTLRHSWATTAKYRGVPIEMISESLGHKSIKTTQIYLKGFELEERTRVNKLNYSYVCSFKMF